MENKVIRKLKERMLNEVITELSNEELFQLYGEMTDTAVFDDLDDLLEKACYTKKEAIELYQNENFDLESDIYLYDEDYNEVRDFYCSSEFINFIWEYINSNKDDVIDYLANQFENDDMLYMIKFIKMYNTIKEEIEVNEEMEVCE